MTITVKVYLQIKSYYEITTKVTVQKSTIILVILLITKM